MLTLLVLALFMTASPFLSVAAAHPPVPVDGEIQLNRNEREALKPDFDDSDVATSFAELPDYVNLGDTIFVTDLNGHRGRAEIQELGTDRIQVLSTDGPIVLSEDDVREIHVQYSDPVGNGALIGGAIAGGTAVGLALAYPEGESDIAAVAIFTGIGLGLGAGFDALHKGQRLVYENPHAGSGTRVSFYPVLGKHRRGIGVSVSF